MNSRITCRITPRNGHTLEVGVVARISGCANQKELSLEDQQDHARQVVAELYDGPCNFRVTATKGKGERLDRPELREIEDVLRTGELDFLIAEDIGRLVRGADAVRLCGIAVDNRTRVIAPNDCIDTAEDSWEEDVISACRDHVGHNAHTSKRLKQKLMNRFVRHGGATPCETFGYIKQPGAKTYDDWQKDPGTIEVFAEWLRILQETGNCSAVADFLNREAIPTGKYCRRRTWNGPMVRRITRNPLLKGMPGRGFTHTIKHHETGRRIAVKNPQGPKFREYPHLAYWDAADFDEINLRLDEANWKNRRKPLDGRDPLWRVARKRTRFPGQHVCCWYCGRQCVWGGNGINENLMCSGARQWRCWNSIGFSGSLATERIIQAITSELAGLEGFAEQFRGLVEQARREGGTTPTQALHVLSKNEQELARRKENLIAAITDFGAKPEFRQKLMELEAQEKELTMRRLKLKRLREKGLKLPDSIPELRRMFDEKFRTLAHGSPEFGDLLRLIVPQFHVYLVRLCDGGHLLPRARVTLNLAGVASDTAQVPELEALLTRTLTLDLFEPPQRERIREEIGRLTARGLKQRQIASCLPEKATQAVVSKANILARMMRERGLDTAYEVVMKPPQDYLKLRRCRNPRYTFQMKEGYQRPMI